MSLYIALKDKEKCRECGFCWESVCQNMECIGCGACSLACPYEAIRMVEREKEGEITIEIEENKFTVPDKITVKKALSLLGYELTKKLGSCSEHSLFAPCEVGGCWSCAVKIDGELKPSCITPVREGVKVELDKDFIPERLVQGFMGHTVGGVGTPWWLKSDFGYLEVACFACGCNFRCPQCQNWTTTYNGKGKPLTSGEAAEIMTRMRRRYGVNRMAISGGECTLNRSWLIQYIKELKRFNPDKEARFHVDTNGSLLTRDYIDELVEAGMTDIGIDLKSFYLDTFRGITGLENEILAQIYLNTAWEAAKYIAERYQDKVFLGLGIPYNKDLISFEEISRMGEEIAKLNPEVQVCALDYRPEFRRREIARPSFKEMKKVHAILREAGLKAVICQSPFGHIGPE